MLIEALTFSDPSDRVLEKPEHDPAPEVAIEYVTVPDAHLLFNGEFKRVGTNDLKIVGDDGQSFFIPGYFASENRAHLMSPQGATLSAQVVEALAGPLAPGQYAQASAQPSGQPVIGRVDAASGSATVVRNGVTIALNVGDTVRRGDVVQTSGSSTVAIVFTDGSTFSLGANARMVLDNFVYTEGASGNSALINLVQGTVSFVAGQMAKTGDMRVETPVATLGIRGTAVLVEISAVDGTTRFAVMREPDGSVGSFNIYNKTTGALIATVNNSETGWVVTPAGPQQVLAQPFQKSPAELQQENNLIQLLFTIFNNNQQNPFTAPPGDRGDLNNQNQTTGQGGGGSGETFVVEMPVVSPDGVIKVVLDLVYEDVPDSGPVVTDPVTAPAVDTGGGGGSQVPSGGGDTPTEPSGPILIDFRTASGPQTIAPFLTAYDFTGPNVIYGSQFNDVIDAAEGDDTVFAEGGDDAIVAGSGEGNDSYDGGEGLDIIIYTSANGVVFRLNRQTVDGVKQSTAQSSSTGNDVFANIEVIIASPGNDIFFVYGDGDWVLEGGTGFDTLNLSNRSEGIDAQLYLGSSGTTTLLGLVTAPDLGTISFSSIESIVGTSGNDNFEIVNFDDFSVLDSEAGWEIRGGGGSDRLRIQGDTGLIYDLDAETFLGVKYSIVEIGAGQLRFASIETLVAGGGDDVFVVRALNGLKIEAGGGFDRGGYRHLNEGIEVKLAAGTVIGLDSGKTNTLRSVENITGSRFADIYNAVGFSGSSSNAGSNGALNSFEGMGGDDTVIGNGLTIMVYVNATGRVIADIQEGIATGNASIGTDTFSGVSGLRGSNYDDILRGSNTTAMIETFFGERGDDLINGRGGLDRAIYSPIFEDRVTGGITVNMASGIVTGNASVGTDTLRSVEMVRGTRFDDTYNAVGFSGSSTNAGSSGTFNEFEGGAGNDTITGNGNTRIAFYLATSGVTVDLAAGYATGDASVGTDTLNGGVNGVVGSQYDDIFYGRNNAPGTGEIFEGRAGNDYIDGRGGYDVANYGNDSAVASGIYVNMAAGTVSGDASIGYDTLRSIEVVRGTNFADTYVATGFGSTSTNAGSNGTFNEFEGLGGNDTITGNGDTRISYASATGGVTVNLATGIASGNASVGTDHFTGVTRVRGSNFNDNILGGTTNDVLEGMDGDDVIDGKGGFDILTGGAGNDILTGGAGQDIFAFQNGFGEDVITDFNPGEIDQIDLTGVSGVTDFSTLMSLADQDGADTVIDFGNGDVIRLSNVYMYYLSSSDFIFASGSIGF